MSREWIMGLQKLYFALFPHIRFFHYFCKMKRELGHPHLQAHPHRIKLKKSKNSGHTQGMSLQTRKLTNSSHGYIYQYRERGIQIKRKYE